MFIDTKIYYTLEMEGFLFQYNHYTLEIDYLGDVYNAVARSVFEKTSIKHWHRGT